MRVVILASRAGTCPEVCYNYCIQADKIMTCKNRGKTNSPPNLKLVDCLSPCSYTGKIRTGSMYRKDTIENIKKRLSPWMANSSKPIRGKQLDVAIVIKCSPQRMKKQDTDNIAKVICDALKERKGDTRYLFNDDSQIIRLLVWKIQRTDNQYYDTDSYDISFRIHDCNKPMTLIPSSSYIRMKG